MDRYLLFLCCISFFVDAAKRTLDFGRVSEEPPQKIQRLSQEDAVSAQESNLSILADLIPLILHCSNHRLAHSLSQVNHACFKSICTSCSGTARTMPRLLTTAYSHSLVEQPWKTILNFAFQHRIRAKDSLPDNETASALVKILTGLDNKTICIAVTGMLKLLNLDKLKMNGLFKQLGFIHNHRENNGFPTPYSTIYPKIMMGGYDSFSEQINNEIVRMLRYMGNPNVPAYDTNTKIYHTFFQDMFLAFPEFCKQKYLELLDTEEICLLDEYNDDYTGIFMTIMGPYADLVASALDTEPIQTRLKANNFDYLWKIFLTKLTFLPQRNLIQLNPQADDSDPEILAEIGRVLKLVSALETSDEFSLEGLNDVKIKNFMNYITHSIQVNQTFGYVRSIAAEIVNAQNVLTPSHLGSALCLAGYDNFIYHLIQEKLSALPFTECVLEHLKFIGPTAIENYVKYHTVKKLPNSLVPLIQSNLHSISRGDKVMADKYEAVFSFMANSFPDTFGNMVSLVVSAALSDKLLSEEKTLFFLFDQIPGMTVPLREWYNFRCRVQKMRTE